jgi:predicted nucleotide-binding protein (sugar kinase/HSP70/actin superfamily)
MPTASGPCRFGQYNIFMDDLISRLRLQDVALFTLTSENSYVGLSISFEKRAWWASVISDVMEDVRSMILANAKDTGSAISIFNGQWLLILEKLEKWNYNQLQKQLSKSADMLKHIPMKFPIEEVPVITLTGEIFIRRDSISRQFITERLAEKGFAVRCSPNSEWMYYSDYLVDKGLVDYSMPVTEKLWYMMRKSFMGRYEKKIKAALSRSGLFYAEAIDIGEIIKNAAPYISPKLAGEAILTIGCSLTEVASKTCGVIAIGPFGCMPNRLSESILNTVMNRKEKLKIESGDSRLKSILLECEDLPFLAIESDGSPFPQIIEAKLDAFCLRAGRLHRQMMKYRQKN